MVGVAEHAVQTDISGYGILAGIEIAIETGVRDEREERLTHIVLHDLFVLFLLTPPFEVPHEGAHTVVFRMEVMEELRKGIDDHSRHMGLELEDA